MNCSTRRAYYRDGLRISLASFRIVRFAFLLSGSPAMPTKDSNKLITVFHSVGRALLPTWHSASTVKCSNWTSIVGSWIPTLQTMSKHNLCELCIAKASMKVFNQITIWAVATLGIEIGNSVWVSNTETHKLTCLYDSWASSRTSHYLLLPP